MIVACILFGLAALGGVFLATRRFQNKDLPFGVAIAHGLAAAAGLIPLLVTVMGATERGGAPVISLGLFVVAALGGFALFSFYLRKRQLPIPLVVVHGLVAVTALLVLLTAVLGK
jgi:hypothetical protein